MLLRFREHQSPCFFTFRELPWAVVLISWEVIMYFRISCGLTISWLPPARSCGRQFYLLETLFCYSVSWASLSGQFLSKDALRTHRYFGDILLFPVTPELTGNRVHDCLWQDSASLLYDWFAIFFPQSYCNSILVISQALAMQFIDFQVIFRKSWTEYIRIPTQATSYRLNSKCGSDSQAIELEKWNQKNSSGECLPIYPQHK